MAVERGFRCGREHDISRELGLLGLRAPEMIHPRLHPVSLTNSMGDAQWPCTR